MHKNEKIKSLRGKIILAIIAVVCLTLLCVGAISLIGANRITKTLSQSNEEMTQTSRSRSSSSLVTMTQTRLRELANGKAELADRMFYEFEEAVSNAATAAELLYANADSYSPRDVETPRMENDGKLALQALYATGVDPDDEEIRRKSVCSAICRICCMQSTTTGRASSPTILRQRAALWSRPIISRP